MLEFTVGGNRHVTTKTDKDCRLHWERVLCLSLPVEVNAGWFLSCRVVSCRAV
jgi:hypothetical protein